MEVEDKDPMKIMRTEMWTLIIQPRIRSLIIESIEVNLKLKIVCLREILNLNQRMHCLNFYVCNIFNGKNVPLVEKCKWYLLFLHAKMVISQSTHKKLPWIYFTYLYNHAYFMHWSFVIKGSISVNKVRHIYFQDIND